MTLPRGLRTPKRVAFAIPILAITLAAIVVIGFALAHLLVKGNPSPEELHARQAAKGMEVKDREPYGLEDFTEPQEK